MFLVSNPKRVDVPYLTARLPSWSGARQNVEGSSMAGKPIPPSNFPMIQSSETNDFVIIKPEDDPNQFFNVYSVLYLVPGANYKWSNISLYTPTIINGQGASVTLNGDGPIFDVAVSTEAVSPVSLYIVFNAVNFVGGKPFDRTTPMSLDVVTQSAVWITDVWKTTFLNCSFSYFKGAALFFKENNLASSSLKGSQQHLVSNCKFTYCRIGIANSGFSEYSIASTNSFYDCHIAFHVYGGYWIRSNNLINKCGSGFFHITSSNMWYLSEGSYTPLDFGTFSNNNVHYTDTNSGNLWPLEFTLPSGTVQLSGMYCQSGNALPPLYLGNSHLYSSFNIASLPGHIYCVTGCKFYGTESSTTYSYVKVPSAQSANIYFLGCFGNSVQKVNVTNANMLPMFGVPRNTRLISDTDETKDSEDENMIHEMESCSVNEVDDC